MSYHYLRAPRPAASPPAARQPGPVTMALRAMQSGIPETERERVRALRRRIADRIEADIALLDMLSGDPDLEPYLSAPEDAATSRFGRYGSQEAWGAGSSDDREDDAGDNGEPEEDDDQDAGCGDREGASEQYGIAAGGSGSHA